MERYNFLRTLTKSIPDYQVRNAIAADVSEQIDELIPTYEKRGMTRRQAERKAIANMGKPEEVIAKLVKKHKLSNEVKNILIYVLFSSLGYVAMWGFVQSGLFKDDVVATMLSAAGYLLILYGILSGTFGNVTFPFKNQFGGYAFNSYVVCAFGTSLVARDYIQWIIWTIILGVIVCVERAFSKKKQRKKAEKFIWKTGEVVSDIDHKGTIKIDGEIQKARNSKDSLKCGTKVVVVNVDATHLIVEKV